MAANIWRTSADDFAARVDMEDLAGFVRKDLIVEPGTRAILLVDGRSEAGALGPGRYEMRSHPLKPVLTKAQTRTALLVDVGDVDVRFRVDPRREVPLVADLIVVVRLQDAIKFFVNLMHGQPRYTRRELAEYLLPEVRNAVREVVRDTPLESLRGDLAVKERLGMAIARHLDETQAAVGLKFERVRALEFLDAVHGWGS